MCAAAPAPAPLLVGALAAGVPGVEGWIGAQD
jgi:hypothetical protein